MRSVSFFILSTIMFSSAIPAASARPADEAVVARLQMQVQKQEELIRQLIGGIDELRHQASAQQKQISQAPKQVESNSQDMVIKQLSDEIEQLRQQTIELKKQLVSQTSKPQAPIKEYDNDIKQLRGELAQTRKESEELKQQLIKQNNTSEIQNPNNDYAHQIQQLRSELSQNRKQTQELMHLIDQQKQEFAQVEENDKQASILNHKNQQNDTNRQNTANAYTNELSSQSPIKMSSESTNGPIGLGKQEIKSTPERDYSEAIDLLNQRRFAEAEVALEQFLKNYPKDPLAVNVTYWLAETFYNRSNYEQAALKFGEAYEAYLRYKGTPHVKIASMKAPEIMLKLAMSLSNIGKNQDSKIILDEMEKEFSAIPGNLKQQMSLLRREIARKNA